MLNQEEQVDKILTSLRGTYWLIKRSANEEGKYMDTLTFEELMGKLKAFEVRLQISGETIPKKIEAVSLVPKPHVEKSIAFKASQSDELKQLDEDFAFLSKSFGKYLKNNKARTGNVWGNIKSVGDSSSPCCFRCNEVGHMKVDCPLMKTNKKKGKEPAQPSRSFKEECLQHLALTMLKSYHQAMTSSRAELVSWALRTRRYNPHLLSTMMILCLKKISMTMCLMPMNN